MNLAMETNSIDRKTYIKKFTTSILRARTKETIICKKKSYTFKYLKSTFQIAKNRQRFNASTCKVHWKNIIKSILLLKPMPTIV
jgi:ribosome-associated toxin RatA of RatAB toxin-antitoxin module